MFTKVKIFNELVLCVRNERHRQPTGYDQWNRGTMLIISKTHVVNHTFIVASHHDDRLCKILNYTTGRGYSIAHSINGENDTMYGFSEDIDEAVDIYNSIV